MYPQLKKSYKNRFPFKICTTSYIYPEPIVPNVRLLASFMDEIELLLFESSNDSLPGKDQIKTLFSLANEFKISYNVHLPLDIFPGDNDPLIRQYAVDTIKCITDLTALLSPSTYTLHLPYNEQLKEDQSVKVWIENIRKSMTLLSDSGLTGKAISIETLMYPFSWVENIIKEFNFAVCLDLGHLMLQKTDLGDMFNKYRQITPIIHLHGVKNHKDHIAIDELSPNKTREVMQILKKFTGVLSVEVFSYKHLTASLTYLEKLFFKKDSKGFSL